MIEHRAGWVSPRPVTGHPSARDILPRSLNSGEPYIALPKSESIWHILALGDRHRGLGLPDSSLLYLSLGEKVKDVANVE